MTEQKPEPELDTATELVFRVRYTWEQAQVRFKEFADALKVVGEHVVAETKARQEAADSQTASLERRYQAWKTRQNEQRPNQ